MSKKKREGGTTVAPTGEGVVLLSVDVVHEDETRDHVAWVRLPPATARTVGVDLIACATQEEGVDAAVAEVVAGTHAVRAEDTVRLAASSAALTRIVELARVLVTKNYYEEEYMDADTELRALLGIGPCGEKVDPS